MNRNKITKIQKHACVRCAKAKVRCRADTVQEHGKCRRCYDSNEDCVFESMAPRQQRRRTDTRLTSLEKQMQALKTVYENAHPDPNRSCNPASTLPQEMSHNLRSDMPTGCSPYSSHTTQLEPDSHESPVWEQDLYNETIPGYIGSELLSAGTAIELFKGFMLYALPQYPVLALNNNDSFESLRVNHPILLFARITAASRAEDATLFENLHTRLLRLLTDKAVINGERSIELLQSVLIMEIWYNPPEDLGRLNFYLWVQIAGTMVLELGLWWDSRMLSDVANSEADSRTMDRWRTALAVYLSISIVSVSSRRPRMIKITESARTALNKYTADAGEQNDKRLAAWMHLQIIAEDIEDIRLQARHRVDVHTNSVKIYTDTLQDIVNRLDQFESNAVAMMNVSLRCHCLWTRTKLNELIVLHQSVLSVASLNTSDRSASRSYCQKTHQSRSLAYASALIALVRSCHSIFDHVLMSDLQEYLHYPTVTTIRALYAMKELVALRESFKNTECSFQSLTGDEFLSLEPYLSRLEKFFTEAKGSTGHKIPTMALTTIYRIQKRILDGGTKLQTDASAPSGSQSIAIEASQLDPENDLEAVTTSTLISLKHDDQPQIQQQPLQQLSTSDQSIDSTTHAANDSRSFRADYPGDNSGVYAVSINDQPTHLGPDYTFMTDPIPFPDPFFWGSSAETGNYEWGGVTEDFNFAPPNW